MRYDYIPIDAIFSKLVRDATDDFNEDDVIEWCGEALDQTGTVKSYQEQVALIEVKNHQCDLPKWLHAVIQVARDNQWTNTRICPGDVVEAVKDEVHIPVALDCYGQPINDYEVAYYRPYFDLKAEYLGWGYSHLYRQRFSPVRASAHTFGVANEILCIEKDQSIYRGVTDEYTLIGKKTARFSFREGMVAIAYLKQVVDERGYPMVPDSTSHKEAITRYIRWKILDRQCFNGREGACGKAEKEEAQWHWYCKQSGNKDLMVQGIDEHQNLLDQRSYLLPRLSRYYGFFGNLARPEQRRWNNPDGRSSSIYR